ncbi:MAG: hypothetical protein M1834_002936 [Cirrosporium novae-zelandiae]|nr:MAG: hypothetical protein M1834_002936 [Cirrosporium novae-zelandiae]
MNGLGFHHGSYGDPRQNSHMVSPPPNKVLLDGYKESFETSIEERPRYNPLNKARPRSSALLNINDPVVMHLLMETAMADSREYEVLSYEEIEEIKKELSLLNSRIDATKRKLALESKLRDAAQSLHRLYSPKSRNSNSEETITSPKRTSRRISLLGHRHEGSDPIRQSDDEFAISTRKCEDLAQELWKLEGRAQDIQMRLLQHTAGILQMTHKGIIQNDSGNYTLPISPESMSRGSLPTIDSIDDFDERSLYRPVELFDAIFDGKAHSNMRSEDETKRDTIFAQQSLAIQDTERKLESLNKRMHEMILEANPANPIEPPPQASEDDDNLASELNLQPHLDYLENGIMMLHNNQTTHEQESEKSAIDVERKLENLNHHLHEILCQADAAPLGSIQPPPRATGTTAQVQIEYMTAALDRIEHNPDSMTTTRPHNNNTDKADEYQTVLTGLWDIIVAGEEDAQRWRSAQNDHPSSPLSPTGELTPEREFSLQAFSIKVQTMHSRYNNLQDQKHILTRQIQQQRALNSKSDAEKDAQFADLTEQLETLRRNLETKRHEATISQDQLSNVQEQLESSQRELSLLTQQKGANDSATLEAERETRRAAEENLLAQLRQKEDDLARLEEDRREGEEELLAQMKEKEEELLKLQSDFAEIRDDAGIAKVEMQATIDDLEMKLHQSSGELKASKAELIQLSATVTEKEKEVEKVQSELQQLEGEVVRLQTELTVSRAELDGAYGTRAQRAAEVAANPMIQREIDELNERNTVLTKELNELKTHYEVVTGQNTELQKRVQTLEHELQETISEFEFITAQGIQNEREHENLEHTIDGLKDRCEALEGQLSDEKVRWLGVKSPGAQVREGTIESTSTMVLKNEFKKMMRETRAENMKALRAEQDERRKLEAVIRNLRKEHGPRRTGLSQSVTAT